MHVLYLHQHFSTPKGAAGTRSYEMAQYLLRHGHSVTMVCGSYSGADTGLLKPFNKGRREGMVDGIHVIEFHLVYSNSDNFFNRVITFGRFSIKSVVLSFVQNYDILFATSTPLTAGIPGVFVRWLRRKPFVFEVRDLWPELPKAMGVIKNPLLLGLMSLLEWVSYRSASRCIGLAPGIVEGIKRRGVKEDKVLLVPNGCDLSVFQQAAEPWRPDGVDENDLMAVFAGTHGLANGLDAVIEVAIELRKRNCKDIKLVLVGQGKFKAQLQKKASDLRLDNIVFVPPVSKQKLSGLLADADVGLQILANVPAFYYGTSPNKFFDYLSAGLPVIINYPGWLAQLVDSQNCGFAVEPESPKAFADALHFAHNNRVVLLEMGKRSKRLAKEQFDRKLLACNWMSWVIGTKS